MSLEKFENFGELSWDEENKPQKIHQHPAAKKIIIGLGVFSFFLVFFIAQYMYNNTENLYDEYFWLNRCGAQCQKYVLIDRIDKNTNCDSLYNLYHEEQKNYPLYWRLAVDDRSTSLGCKGFPKTMTQIKAEAAKVAAEKIAKQAAIKEERSLDLQNDIHNKQPRFMQSMVDGNLMNYVVTSSPSAINPANITIVVSQVFLDLPLHTKEQLASTIWQKWANINTPKRPTASTISLYNSANELVGESDPKNPRIIQFTDN